MAAGTDRLLLKLNEAVLLMERDAKTLQFLIELNKELLTRVIALENITKLNKEGD